MSDTCPFCERIRNGEYEYRSVSVVMFEPLNPVTMGHTLVVPIRHAESAAHDPLSAACAMDEAACYVAQHGIDANILTSIGAHATQTVKHTHIHIVPRWEGDGLHLPWTGQKRDNR